MTQDIRWKQRFDNFKRAFYLLREMIDAEQDFTSYESIVKEGIIQRFEYCFELAWKTLKDKMEYDGLTITRVSPKPLLKQAYQSKYINNIELWLKMANDRNLMSHTYNFNSFDQVLKNVQQDYYPLLEALYDGLTEGLLIDESDFPYLCDLQYLEEIKNPHLLKHIQRIGKVFYRK